MELPVKPYIKNRLKTSYAVEGPEHQYQIDCGDGVNVLTVSEKARLALANLPYEAAQNYPHTIDPAILRAGRLDKKYYVGVPDLKARKALFELYLKDRPYDFGLDYEELARLTENYVSADIQLIVNDASRTALKLHSKITMDLLRTAIKGASPSISLNELERYQEIKAHMEGGILRERRIGFK